jgi:NADPH:quinone reductase-like Zn-dependent oxidoreductase
MPLSSFDRMNPFLAEHKIEPEIESVYAFEEAIEAFKHLSRGAFGKIVIKVSR